MHFEKIWILHIRVMEKFIVEAGKGEKCRLMKLVNLEKDKGLRLSPKIVCRFW